MPTPNGPKNFLERLLADAKANVSIKAGKCHYHPTVKVDCPLLDNQTTVDV
jgi:hypothetical protein